jgi:hypothetical protein
MSLRSAQLALSNVAFTAAAVLPIPAFMYPDLHGPLVALACACAVLGIVAFLTLPSKS